MCALYQTCCISPQHQTTLFLLSRRRLRNLLCVLPRRVTTNTRCSGCQQPTRFIPFRTREGSVRRDLQSRAHCACCLPQRSPLNCRGFEEPAPHIFAPHQNPSSPKRSRPSMLIAFGDARLCNRCSQASETASFTRKRLAHDNRLVSSSQPPSLHATHIACTAVTSY
jgi:hypothetical protein